MEEQDKVADIYREFTEITISQLEARLSAANTREEKVFCRAMINLKLQMTQEKVIGEILL